MNRAILEGQPSRREVAMQTNYENVEISRTDCCWDMTVQSEPLVLTDETTVAN